MLYRSDAWGVTLRLHPVSQNPECLLAGRLAKYESWSVVGIGSGSEGMGRGVKSPMTYFSVLRVSSKAVSVSCMRRLMEVGDPGVAASA